MNKKKLTSSEMQEISRLADDHFQRDDALYLDLTSHPLSADGGAVELWRSMQASKGPDVFRFSILPPCGYVPYWTIAENMYFGDTFLEVVLKCFAGEFLGWKNMTQ